jgi:hypothetical protein
MDLSKTIRDKRETRIETKDLGLPMPGNPSKERWSRYSSTVEYHITHKIAVLKHSVLSVTQKRDLAIATPIVEPTKPVFDVLRKSMNMLQTPGPMMAFLLPMIIATVYAEMRELTSATTWPTDLENFGKCLTIRFLRRFFDDESWTRFTRMAKTGPAR